MEARHPNKSGDTDHDDSQDEVSPHECEVSTQENKWVNAMHVLSQPAFVKRVMGRG